MAERPLAAPSGAAAPRAGVLEAVLFDAGGTLVRLDFEWIADLLRSSELAIDVAELRRAEVEGRRRYDSSWAGSSADPAPLGHRGDVRAYFEGTLEAAGVPAARVAPIVERLLERQRGPGLWVRPAEGAREALAAVGALGLRRAVVSNSDGRAEWHLRHTGVFDGIEFVVDSGLVGIEKPDARVFHIALERLGVDPACALYVGDIRSVDEVGARAAGMHFVLIDPSGSYAPPGSPAIREIRELPDWIVTRTREGAFLTGRSSC